MNKKSIAIVELATVSAGIKASDIMVKTAAIELAESRTVCPGKYIIVASGYLGAVTVAVEAAKIFCADKLISSFILGNPHEGVIEAFYDKKKPEKIRALGIFETQDVASAVMAADTAVKTAVVDIVEIRLAKGMCGKSYVSLTGEVSAVEAAIARAKAVTVESGMYLDSTIIARPDEKLEKFLL